MLKLNIIAKGFEQSYIFDNLTSIIRLLISRCTSLILFSNKLDNPTSLTSLLKELGNLTSLI